MALPVWQEKLGGIDESTKDSTLIPFATSKKFFAVDNSGSTAGRRLDTEMQIVQQLHGNTGDTVAPWNSRCGDPRSASTIKHDPFTAMGGTNPASIIQSRMARDDILAADIWILCTDGMIDQLSVTNLTNLAESHGTLQVPVMIFIVGESRSRNLSVGISFFASASEAAILYTDTTTGRTSVIDAKGRFEPLKLGNTVSPASNAVSSASDTVLSASTAAAKASSDAPERTSDEDSFDSLQQLNLFCEERKIQVQESRGRPQYTSFISLGPEWATATGTAVSISSLLQQTTISPRDLEHLTKEETFSQLALVCKTRGQLQELRTLLVRHRVQDVAVRFTDCHDAAKIMKEMSKEKPGSSKHQQLTAELREAHIANRRSYEDRIKSSGADSNAAKQTNRSIDQALALIADFEKLGYTAEILDRKSNRARRADKASSSDADVHILAMDISDNADACRAICSICCGENQIMSIALKEVEEAERNTTDFALNFPLAAGRLQYNADLISSQSVCFQCASLLPISIHREPICVVLPTVAYAGANRGYINHQLVTAITAGLKTGMPGIVQLFATVLDQTLETRQWCSGEASDEEVASRRATFQWMLHNLLENCRCRETFNELGEWVNYPKALAWVIRDFNELGLDSWVIQYPLVGFLQIVRWFQVLAMSTNIDNIIALQRTKLLHTFVAEVMDIKLRSESATVWKYTFFKLIYDEMNAPGVPRNMGTKSLVDPPKFWTRLEEVLDDKSYLKQCLGHFDEVSQQDVARRMQMLLFWILFTQKGHTRPKSFYETIRTREEIGFAILDPMSKQPENEITSKLSSIFLPATMASDTLAKIPEFVSPFGASVLRCGYQACAFRFYNGAKDKKGQIDTAAIRIRRAKHLNSCHDHVGTETGLPDRTTAPVAPHSPAYCLHVSTAKVWSGLTLAERQSLFADAKMWQGTELASFAQKVRRYVSGESVRGDIYSSNIEKDVLKLLPSFFTSLQIASRREGLQDRSGVAYIHDWTKNTTLWKAEYELSL